MSPYPLSTPSVQTHIDISTNAGSVKDPYDGRTLNDIFSHLFAASVQGGQFIRELQHTDRCGQHIFAPMWGFQGQN
jgi:hypothetical protein